MRLRKRTILMIFAGALLTCATAAADTPRSVESLLSEAQTQAAQGQRAIFAIFHASW